MPSGFSRGKQPTVPFVVIVESPMSAPFPLIPPSLPPPSPRPAPPDLGSIDPSLDLEEEIRSLKRQKNAVLLAHYYQEEEIQELADFVGDSLDLSRKAQQ